MFWYSFYLLDMVTFCQLPNLTYIFVEPFTSTPYDKKKDHETIQKEKWANITGFSVYRVYTVIQVND